MTTSAQDERKERRETLLQDEDLRRRQELKRQNEGTTFLAQTHVDIDGGRFAATNAATIIGQNSPPKYPQLPSSSPWSGADPVPDEPPLGHRVDRMPGLEPPAVCSPWPAAAAQAGAPASDDPSPSPVDDVEHDAGAPFSNEGGS
jgi:hypothetical protein